MLGQGMCYTEDNLSCASQVSAAVSSSSASTMLHLIHCSGPQIRQSGTACCCEPSSVHGYCLPLAALAVAASRGAEGT